MDEDTGIISGYVPAGAAQASPYSVTIEVFHDNEGNDTVQFNWTVKAARSLSNATTPGDCNQKCPKIIATAPGLEQDETPNESEEPVRYADGTIKLESAELLSAGFGQVWGHTRSWTNNSGYAPDNLNGSGMVIEQQPFLIHDSTGNHLVLITSGSNARYFDRDPDNGTYTPRFFLQETLTYDAPAGQFVLTDTTGNVLRFWDFNVTRPVNQRGQFQSFTAPGGQVVEVTSRTADGKPLDLQRSNTSGGVTTTESLLYSYVASGPNAGLLESVQLRRRENSDDWSIVRQAEYAYYTDEDTHGNTGDLKTATIKDGAGIVLDTEYYRYYTSDQNGGYVHGLKYLFRPASFARLQAAVADPFSAEDDQVAPYADNLFAYDGDHRVTTEVAQGAGSSANGGLGTFTFTYATPSTFANDFNQYRYTTIESLPDGNQHIVYSNYAGEVMLFVFHETSTGRDWSTFYRYDDAGRLVTIANPSAVTGYDPTYADLLNQVDHNYQYLADNTGLIQKFTYPTETTATETGAGDVAGYLSGTSIQQGELGTSVPQTGTEYLARTAGATTIYVVAGDTVYRNTDKTGAEKTSYAYTWFTDTVQPQSITVSYPAISSSQNGSGTSDQEVTVFDQWGRPIWSKDGAGFLHYTAYDLKTGAVVKTITDVDTSKTNDFQDVPAGWNTPGGGGLHLKTEYNVDGLGRTTATTDPNGNTTYTVYNDAAHEIRIYQGWQLSTETPTGPTMVIREDRAHGYVETLTMTATPSNDGTDHPTGTEEISSLQTLARSYRNTGGQVIQEDAYFNLAQLVYSVGADLGTQGTHFYRTVYRYDSNGQLDRVQSPTGTITQRVNDGLGRVVSEWVGTTDSNLVEIQEHVYDGGLVGDSNLTQTTEFPGLGAAPRVTQFFYDWRNRLVASKAGVQATETDGVNRPIVYFEYDNLDQVIATSQFAGDGVTVSLGSDGVPVKPDGALLRSYTTASYDDQGRLFRSQVYSVDLVTGAVSAASLRADIWYDARGQVIKTAQPGGLVQKNRYDGAGRLVATYLTDGGADTSWADAGNVTGDIVLSQSETKYDGANPVMFTTRERFHDETASGELGNPSTGPKARVSYVGSYYDPAQRLTATANFGTNHGQELSLPANVPDRSDTVLVNSVTYNAAGWIETTTDPRGIVTRLLHDALGQVLETMEAYTDGIPDSTHNRTTEYRYNAAGQLASYQALHVPSPGTEEQTLYFHTVSTDSGSALNSNEILGFVARADNSYMGLPTILEVEPYTVNALGQVVSHTDRNGTVHHYTYDVLGRQTADTVTTLGSGVDGAVRRIETAYDSAGRPYLFTSYDAVSGGNVVNQVQWVYNGLGQLVTEYQAHNGAVNTATTPKVQYAYAEMAEGANHSRLVSMTYPNGRVLSYNYASGLDDRISRLSSLSDSSGTLETYTYLGLNTVVQRAQPEPGIELTYLKQGNESAEASDGGDQYTGLDRFGRVVDQRWLQSNSGVLKDRFQYGYDRDSNRLFGRNLVAASFSELYGYDDLNQLTNFERGTLTETNDAISGMPSRIQSWQFDSLGNWTTFTTDGTTQERDHNLQNQITWITGAMPPAYDSNGNMKRDEIGRTLVFDGWNRLVAVKNATGSTTLVSYSYDALGQRITENTGTVRDLYYSASWQVLEERVNGSAQIQYVWSPMYVDALVERDRDADGNGSLEERLYVLQDANWNVTAVVSTSGLVQERYLYDPYGKASVLAPNDWSARSSSFFAWNYLHQGGRYDATSRLYSFRNRDYSATLGRWVEQDPLGFAAGDSNLYEDVRNSPTNLRDLFGLTWDDLVNLFRYPGDALSGAREGLKNMAIGAGGALYEGAAIATDTAAYSGQKMVSLFGLRREYTPRSAIYQGWQQAPDKLRYGLEAGVHMGLNTLTVGGWGVYQGWDDFNQTGDATRASQMMGGVAVGNAAGAGLMKLCKGGTNPSSGAPVAESRVPAQLRAGTAHEAERLAQLGAPKNTVTWRPTQADIDSAAFKVIVGKPKYTAGSTPKGTIFDVTQGGLREIKGGTSVLDSSYQLRLQTYYSLKNNLTYTIETARPVNPTFQSWLDRWGVIVEPPK